MFYTDVVGVFLCFDLTDEDSYEAINFWLQDLERHAPANVTKIMCGLKLDLVQSLDESRATMGMRD